MTLYLTILYVSLYLIMYFQQFKWFLIKLLLAACILQYSLLLDVVIDICFVFTMYLINLADTNRRYSGSSSSVSSPFSDRVGLPHHNTPIPGVLMKSIGAAFLRLDALPDVNHMRGMQYQIVLNIIFWPEIN